MSVEQLSAQVLALPAEQRRQFMDWLDDHRHEILPDDDISAEMAGEILRRSTELREQPGLAEAVDGEYFERMKRRVADALAQKTSAL